MDITTLVTFVAFLALFAIIGLSSVIQKKKPSLGGHDIKIDDTPIEAELGFAVSFKKEGGFFGKDALLKQKEEGIKKRWCSFY